MVEFIGILSLDLSLAHHDQASDELELRNTPGLYFEENTAEVKAHHPPSSLVPRLHCITAYKMAHSNPLLMRTLQIPVSLTGKCYSICILTLCVSTVMVL